MMKKMTFRLPRTPWFSSTMTWGFGLLDVWRFSTATAMAMAMAQ
jgi:hypothetical protein